MKNPIKYYALSLLIALMVSFSTMAQTSFNETKHADKVLRKEAHRESARQSRANRKAAKAEKRINKKAKYKSRTKVKLHPEKAPSEKRRWHRSRRKQEVRD